MTFCVTFGQDHPLRDNWIEVEAPNAEQARARVFESFGSKWSFLYLKDEFNPKYFPGGKVGITIE